MNDLAPVLQETSPVVGAVIATAVAMLVGYVLVLLITGR
jgi:hypothetical protein